MALFKFFLGGGSTKTMITVNNEKRFYGATTSSCLASVQPKDLSSTTVAQKHVLDHSVALPLQGWMFSKIL